ncbi:MAG: universal stress protein [Candidatus Lokiarchaeota archaeon]|nr:universal stress protein [Candidatus Lokiarchaeota archaeon]
MFNKILVPFDGSDHSVWSLQNAIEIGKLYKSEIIVYHSIKHYFRAVKANTFFPFFGLATSAGSTMSQLTGMEADPMALDPAAEEQVFRSQKRIGERLLAEARKRVEAAGLKCETILTEFQGPVDAAKDIVEKMGIDLVIVGARGVHNAVERVLLGSVSSGIVNSVCTNIMVMRSECAASHGE